MNKKERAFVRTIWDYYKRHGRRSLPWRRTKNPYHILVSEVMLQQTQVDRVIPKYKSFLKKFPTVEALSEASLGDVLREWQGLGYNRRARMLHNCAKTLSKNSRGRTPKVPCRYEELVKLPGIGPYTAGAVMAFAYNEPVVMIETNIRSAYIHHFFHDDTDITDPQIVRLIELTLDTENPREWYWALMDYGAFIKKEFGNPNSRSKHYAKQSKFEGSDRQIRGAILRALSKKEETRKSLHRELPFDYQRIDEQLEKLEREEMINKKIQKKKRSTQCVYALPG